jgi:3-hydroxymyristoyl/3-hydroxydecanoyl-(acyl carrier protein) dehydratase
MVAKHENDFQAGLIKELKDLFPGCIVMKNDSSYIQGIPDLLILYKDRWATLECKRSLNAIRQPNQEYYVAAMDGMSFSRFICPENKEDILHELERSWKT